MSVLAKDTTSSLFTSVTPFRCEGIANRKMSKRRRLPFLVIGRYGKDSYYHKLYLYQTFVENAYFLIHHADETENKNSAPVDRQRVSCSAEEILSKVGYGKKAYP